MKKILFILTSFTLILSSCLKDKGYDNYEYGLKPSNVNTAPLVQILEGGLSKFSTQKLSVDLTLTRDTTRFSIFYIDKDLPASQDLTVTLDFDAAALAEYNTANPAQMFEKLPDSTFIFPKKSIVIKAGQKVSDLIDIVVFPNKVDPGKLYMYPITIKTISNGATISKNNGTIFYHIIGNPLAGNYKSTGFFYHPTAPRAINIALKNLPALSANSLELQLGDIGAYVVLTLDASNSVTIADVGGVPVGITNTATLVALPAQYTPFPGSIPAQYNNTYDPVTKTFYLRYGYQGGSGPRTIEEKLVRL